MPVETKRKLLYAVNKFRLMDQSYYAQDKKVKEYDSSYFTFQTGEYCFNTEARCISWVADYSELPTG